MYLLKFVDIALSFTLFFKVLSRTDRTLSQKGSKSTTELNLPMFPNISEPDELKTHSNEHMWPLF